MTKHLKKLLLLSGILFAIFLSFLGYRYYQIKVFNQAILNVKLSPKAKHYESSEVSNDWKEIQEAQEKAQEMGIVDNAFGMLNIPSIDLSLPIFHGSNAYTLSLGAGSYFYDDEAGTGNFILSGHNTPYPGMLFTNLVNIKEGAKIEVKLTEKTITYQVIAIQVINDEFEVYEDGTVPENSWLALPKANEKAKISLFTCLDWQTTNERLLVVGEIVG
jgi:LPXTG-site transpeptidase (sortase) family protein